MAITVTPEITGQVASNVFTYCYLFEPLKIQIEESDLSATKIYIDVEFIDMENSATIVQTFLEYGEFDINSGVPITVDLMRMAQQLWDANVYKFGSEMSWSFGPQVLEDKFEAEVYKYRLNFKVYSDQTATPTEVKKWPIIGGRSFQQFAQNPAVDENSPLSEFEYYGLPLGAFVNPPPDNIYEQTLRYRWGNTFSSLLTLNPPNNVNASPSRSTLINNTVNYPPPCAGGFIVWKSRFGAWCWWGFDYQTKTETGTYEDTIEVGKFSAVEVKDFSEPAENIPYVAADYATRKVSYQRTLTAYSVPADELLALQEIAASPAIWYIPELGVNPDGIAELMRLQSVNAPWDTRVGGGDFTVVLKSISTHSENTR